MHPVIPQFCDTKGLRQVPDTTQSPGARHIEGVAANAQAAHKAMKPKVHSAMLP